MQWRVHFLCITLGFSPDIEPSVTQYPGFKR